MKTILNFIFLFFFIIVISILFSYGCKDNSVSSAGECDPSQRTGAVCKDGSTTSSTGSGACSGHGGVDHWQCR